ncbi:MAG TPA: hypothetical protein VD994_15860, partial [Prosthecobacter sp.]|nr:hypothetical protein [Prosthecobacter sp.]
MDSPGVNAPRWAQEGDHEKKHPRLLVAKTATCSTRSKEGPPSLNGFVRCSSVNTEIRVDDIREYLRLSDLDE